MASATATPNARTRRNSVADATSTTVEQVMSGWEDLATSCVDAQRRLMDDMASSVDATVNGRVSGLRAMQSATGVMTRGSIELGNRAVNEMSTLATEQARFMGQLTERCMDAMLGDNAVRSPEAGMATARSLMSDCLDNGTAVSQRMARMGSQQTEAARALCTEFVTATSAAMRTAGEATA